MGQASNRKAAKRAERARREELERWTDGRPSDWGQRVQQAMHEVIDAIVQLRAAHSLHDLPQYKNFPNGSCAIVSYTLAGVLVDRGLEDGDGRWYLVDTADDGSMTHTWLEYRIGNDAVYSVDPTIHQFPSLSKEPWAGPGHSPAVTRFRHLSRVQLFETAQEQEWARPPYIESLRLVREKLS